MYVCLPTRYEGKRYGLPVNFLYEPHSIVVNRLGKRFVSEAHFNIGEALDARNPDGSPVHLPSYLVGDHRFLQSSITFRWYASYAPGQIILYPGAISETEILLAYGGVDFSPKMGQLAGNHFVTLTSNLDKLPELGRLVLWGRCSGHQV
ncbi:Protein of unknown function [Rhizobium hainanense]|uniref:Uncharacterized protein n=1 Tax=Rhizobium hainanense TaxID=52131 RepID=A0A1C3WK24_9HYPH|nr:Protein of unknown function [Rhizobium hainanense]